MKRWIPALLAALLPVAAAADADKPQATPFKDGDRVVVVGDSITHGRNWHAFVALFYATRYPERDIAWFNAGISGDTAEGALRRFDWDIAPHRPTVAMMMLGMNDAGRWLYGQDNPNDKTLKARTERIDAYATNMALLSEKLRKLDCRIVYVTPSIYEQNAELKAKNFHGVNDALGRMGQRLHAMAGRFDAEVIDLHTAMNDLNDRLQENDPTFTLVSPDRVHPLDPGQMVMAAAVIAAQGHSPVVSVMGLDAQADKPATSDNCTIDKLETSPTSVSFTCLEKALPYPQPSTTDKAFEWLDFNSRFNREMLIVKNLAPGNYAVSIDGTPVGTYTAAGLAAGVNLAGNDKTPMHQQAVEVAKHNATRHWVWAGRFRTFALVRHWMLAKAGVDPENFDAVKTYLEERLKDPKLSTFNKRHIELYLKEKPREAFWQDHHDKAVKAMNEARLPKPHTFVIKKVE